MKHPKLIIPLLAIVVVGGFVAHHVFSQASTGSIEAASLQAKNSAVTFNAKPITVHTAYASFRYPAALTPLTNAPSAPPVLANLSYSYPDIETWRLSITINRLSGPETLAGSDSSYQLRASQPNTYQLSSAAYGGQTYAIMNDVTAAGFSKVAYLVHDGQAAEISLYGDDAQGKDSLQSTFATVLTSWRWSN